MSVPQRGVALLDTSVLVDFFKSRLRRSHIKAIQSEFDWTITTDIALLEFKAVLVRQMITIHGALRYYKRFTVARDVLCEKNHPQVKLRFHIFNNLIGVSGGSFEVSDGEDLKLGERARLLLEPLIPKIFRDVQEIAASVQRRIKCTRAEEAPKMRRVTFAVNLPYCVRGKNKGCSVEDFIRDNVLPRIDVLRAMGTALGDESKQFDRACAVFDRVAADPAADLSHGDCRNAGDCLIAFSARGTATHVVSTNRREWQPLSNEIGAAYRHVEYPDEAR